MIENKNILRISQKNQQNNRNKT